ncbi:MAG: CHAT domain-containing protein [Planctomycetaceae bacterium]|nr:CHAT domain-containing protein [Planctomycetaceae bacterium]
MKVIAESSEPGITAAVRTESVLVLDVSRLPDVPTGYSDRAGLLAYGTALGQAVFAGGVGRAFQRAQRGAEAANDVLHVLLSVEEDELKTLRWERMCGELDGTWQFLRLQQRTPFSLHLPSVVDRRYPGISRADLKALVVVANLGPTRPYGLAEFDAAATVRGVREALGEIGATVLACDGAEGVAGCDGLPMLDEICARITAERYPILHLVCHAKYFENVGETYLFLRKPADAGRMGLDDLVHRVPASEFLSRLGMLQSARGLPHLAFLCCCDSAAPEAARVLGGLGQRLVFELGMPAVVGMTEPMAISFAGQLARTFYERLRVHGAVDLALDEACAGVAGHGHVLIPMLFSRLAGRTLFDIIGPLTTGEWEVGLRRLSTLIDERAPVLKERFEGLRRRVLPALEVRKATESRTDDLSSSRQTAETLAISQADLNEICQDFLADSFDSLARGLPLAEPSYDGRCPFPGLGVFDKTQEGDFRPFFFGREALTQEVHQILKERRFVAILGGSGTGKSSLVRAGLLEAMRKENQGLKSVVFPPGRDPLARLELELISIPDPDVIVVDQFEELFTLVADGPEAAAGERKTAVQKRREFLTRLLPLRERCLIVVTLRADFLTECAEYDELYTLLDADQKYLKLLQPLRGNELRDVMERQANATNLQFEPGLAARIFQDIESEPGAMPLLQHCLRQLWQFRHGRWLRLAEYVNDDRVGGVKGAISRTAEDAYRRMSLDDQAVLPYIFERLARIDTDAVEPEYRRDTRRREELAQLTPDGGDPEATKRVVTRLADAKLLVTSQSPETGETEVEVAHEVLIRHWDKLRKWLDAARDTARLVERIRSDSTHYFDSKASPDNLTLRGTVLEDAERLIDSKPPRLSSPEVQFIRLCRAYDRERRDHELRTARTRLRLAVSLAGAALVATLLGVYAYLQWREVGLQKQQKDLEVKNVAAQKAIAAERQCDATLSTYAARIGVVERNIAGTHWARAEADLSDVMSSSAADVGFEAYFLWGQCNRDVIELDTGSKAGARNMVLTNWPLGSTTGVSFLDSRTSLVTGNTMNKLTRWNTFGGLRVWEHECHKFGVWEGITSLAYCRRVYASQWAALVVQAKSTDSSSVLLSLCSTPMV